MKQLVLLVMLFTLCYTSALAQRPRKTEWESGMQEKGEKVGVWEYYSYTREGRQVVVQRYDHSAKQLIYFRPVEDVPYEMEQGTTWVRAHVDQPPLFIGGDAALAAYTTKVNYPEKARTKNIQGRVVISMIIDTLGRASDYKVVQSVGGGCDEEALRVSQTIPAQWVAARKNGHAVTVRREQPFTFKLKQ